MGVVNGWLPGDSVVMFGKMLTLSKDFKVFYPTGLAIHLLNGADLGLFYAFVWGEKGYNALCHWICNIVATDHRILHDGWATYGTNRWTVWCELRMATVFHYHTRSTYCLWHNPWCNSSALAEG